MICCCVVCCFVVVVVGVAAVVSATLAAAEFVVVVFSVLTPKKCQHFNFLLKFHQRVMGAVRIESVYTHPCVSAQYETPFFSFKPHSVCDKTVSHMHSREIHARPVYRYTTQNSGSS